MATNLLVSATPKRSLRANFVQNGESIPYTETETVLSPFHSVTRLKMLPGKHRSRPGLGHQSAEENT